MLALCVAGPALAEGEVVEVWTRKPGQHWLAGGPGKESPARIVLGKLKVETREGPDEQVGEVRAYKGVPLALLVEKAGPRKGDLLLLHFANGMLVPFPNDKAKLDELNAFVATSYKTPGGEWRTSLPSVAKRAEVTMDPRPIHFGASKLVVAKAWHPWLLDPTGESFSPWRHVDTLVGIEFADRAAWEDQFTAPLPEKLSQENVELVKRGQEVYLKSCQYCHASRDVGATYGWDFLVPLPLHSLRKPRDLYEHVTIEKFDALEKGLMMPTQKHLSKRDVAAIWAWNKVLSQTDGLRPYQASPFDKVDP